MHFSPLGRFIKREFILAQVVFCDQQGQCHSGPKTKWQSRCIFFFFFISLECFPVDPKQFVDTALHKVITERRNCWGKENSLSCYLLGLKAQRLLLFFFHLIALEWLLSKDRCQGRLWRGCFLAGRVYFLLWRLKHSTFHVLCPSFLTAELWACDLVQVSEMKWDTFHP